jgi:hypothetical protein
MLTVAHIQTNINQGAQTAAAFVGWLSLCGSVAGWTLAACHFRMVRRISRTGKAVILWLAMAVTVWGFALWRWHGSPELVSGQDIALQLIALPIVLTVVALLAWWVVRRLTALATTPLARPVDANADAHVDGDVAASQGRTGEALRPLAIVLAEAFVLPAGQDADGWQALKEARIRPGLDPNLRDADGLPVFSARVPGLDMSDWAQAHPALKLPEQVLRTLALLEGPIVRLMEAVEGLQDADAQADVAASAGHLPADAPSHLSGVGLPGRQARRQARAASAPSLQVRLWLPASWSDEARTMAMDWLRSRCGALLDWADRHAAQPPEWLTEPLPPQESPEAIWAEMASRWAAWAASSHPQLMLLLAADTAVDAAQVMSWQARGELFTCHHQRGRIPGEAGAGLLLANPAWYARAAAQVGSSADALDRLDEVRACPQLWQPRMMRREHSADVVGRVNTSVTQALLQQAVESALSESPQDWLLVSDGDHRASRTSELFEAWQAVRPQADPMLSVVRAGDACGDMGLARALVPVALASMSLRLGEPNGLAMALMVQDSFQRVAVPLTRPPSAMSPL